MIDIKRLFTAGPPTSRDDPYDPLAWDEFKFSPLPDMTAYELACLMMDYSYDGRGVAPFKTVYARLNDPPEHWEVYRRHLLLVRQRVKI